jgi:hypothetical protein
MYIDCGGIDDLARAEEGCVIWVENRSCVFNNHISISEFQTLSYILEH